MSDPLQQLEQLLNAHDKLTEGMASQKDVIEIFNSVLEVVSQLKDNLDKTIKTNKGEMDDLFTSTVAELKRLETRITKYSDRLEEKMGVDISVVQKQLLSEVKTLRSLIPTLPDLSAIERRIDDVEGLIPKIPDEISREVIRDKLETFRGEARLDVRAVNNAPKMTVSLTPPKEPQIGDLWGVPDR